MPAGTFERTSPSAVAATPASGESTPEKPRTVSENRKVYGLSLLGNIHIFCSYYLLLITVISTAVFFSI